MEVLKGNAAVLFVDLSATLQRFFPGSGYVETVAEVLSDVYCMNFERCKILATGMGMDGTMDGYIPSGNVTYIAIENGHLW